MKTDAFLLASGGLDSTTLAYWLADRGEDFVPVFVDYGQHCAQAELTTLRMVLPPELGAMICTIDISGVYRGSSSRLIVAPDLWRDDMAGDPLYLPYRNLLLLSAAAAFAQSNGAAKVFAGFINSNHAKEIDCSANFFGELARLLAEYGSVSIEMPFRDMSKLEIARLGLTLGVPLAETYSCQAAADVPCGACPNCVDRREALSKVFGEQE